VTVNVQKRAVALQFDADCPAATLVEDLVFVTGPAIGNIIQVDTVDITVVSTMPAIGIVVKKITSTRCRVRTSGEFTISLTLVPGKTYYVGATGQPSLVIPALSPGEVKVFQPIGYAIDTNSLLIKPDLKPIVRKG